MTQRSSRPFQTKTNDNVVTKAVELFRFRIIISNYSWEIRYAFQLYETGNRHECSFYYIYRQSSIPIMVCRTVCSHYTALNSSAFLVLLSVVVCLSLPSLSVVVSYCCQGTQFYYPPHGFNLLLLICKQENHIMKLEQNYLKSVNRYLEELSFRKTV